MMGRAVTCDIVLIGVGGQGVLTIGEILLGAAVARGVPTTFAPTKGMAQRGGFVKAELRLGADGLGPRIREGGADVVASMERSEALKGLRFIKPDGVFVLYDAVWEPTGVMLGEHEYPTRERVVRAIASSGGRVVLIDPEEQPSAAASANVATLGALVAASPLRELLGIDAVETAIAARWPRAAESNLAAFRYGLTVGRATGEDADVVG